MVSARRFYTTVSSTETRTKKLKPRTADDYARLVKKKINPAIGHLLIAKVEKSDIIALHESMANTPRRANYTVRTIGALMTYAEDKQKRPPNSNLAGKISMYREGLRERFLTEAEIADGRLPAA